MVEDLKKFYESKDLDGSDTIPETPSTHGYVEAKRAKTPSQKRLLLNEELNRVQRETTDLFRLMDEAKAREGEPETPERLQKLAELVGRFRIAIKKTVKVYLMEPLLGPEGAPLAEFAMKELAKDETRADRQMEILRKHVDMVKQYYPGIELKEIISLDPENTTDPQNPATKRVAVVLGIGAEEFNAIVLAENTRRMHEAKLKQLKSDIEDIDKKEQDRLDRLDTQNRLERAREEGNPFVMH